MEGGQKKLRNFRGLFQIYNWGKEAHPQPEFDKILGLWVLRDSSPNISKALFYIDIILKSPKHVHSM